MSEVRRAFADQAAWCVRLGGDFTSRLCALLGERVDRSTAVGRRITDWPGDPAPFADGLPLRVCGALHALARSGAAPQLARLYPPAPPPDDEALWAALAAALADESAFLMPWLDRAPQTNEVGRSAVLMAGLLTVADALRMPIRLYELGASAGLNLLLDRYGYDLGGRRAGDSRSPLQLRPEWKGRPPPAAQLRIVGRAGVDLAPARLPQDAERLIAYVWPEQIRRLAQTRAALAIAAADPPRVDRADAGDWIERHLESAPEAGIVRAVMHSIAFQYFDSPTQRQVEQALDRAGAAASAAAPLAWLRYEKEPGEDRISLRLKTWPGKETLLAWAHPHGVRVRWL